MARVRRARKDGAVTDVLAGRIIHPRSDGVVYGPGVAKADLSPSQTDGIIDFTDISACVNAFRGLPYPFTGPVGCP